MMNLILIKFEEKSKFILLLYQDLNNFYSFCQTHFLQYLGPFQSKSSIFQITFQKVNTLYSYH